MKGGKSTMDKSVQITLIVVIGVVLLGIIGIASFAPETNTLTAQGISDLEVSPDLVTIYFNVMTKADTSQEAKDLNSEIVEDVKVNLFKQGLNHENIQTTNFNIYPEYDWKNNQRNLIGYTASHGIKVQISTDNTDKIGEIIDAGADAGATINYISFELSQELQNKYKAQAIELASEDARTKAEAMAQGLDKRLGRLVSVTESSFDYYPWRLYESSDASFDIAEAKQATTDIQPSDKSISARVTAKFKIL